MTKCESCGLDNPKDSPDYAEEGLHNSCHEEWNRREKNDICTFCGKPLGDAEIKKGYYCHPKCYDTDNYQGYSS